jgi:hypothetical protein
MIILRAICKNIRHKPVKSLGVKTKKVALSLVLQEGVTQRKFGIESKKKEPGGNGGRYVFVVTHSN